MVTHGQTQECKLLPPSAGTPRGEFLCVQISGKNWLTFTFHMFKPIYSLLSFFKLSHLVSLPPCGLKTFYTTNTQHLQKEKTRAHTHLQRKASKDI
jgi:hypothetical protein